MSVNVPSRFIYCKLTCDPYDVSHQNRDFFPPLDVSLLLAYAVLLEAEKQNTLNAQ